MNAMSKPRSTFRTRMFPLVTGLTIVVAALAAPCIARAATGDSASAQTVECMLPGQIHNIGGHATMGPRRPVQATPEDCRQQGGEYTVDDHATQPAIVPHVATATVDDGKILNCLLPQQVRQLGEKARYTTARRPIRTTRSDCATKGGDVITSVQARKAAREYRAAVAKQAAQKKSP
jgi:hypothetical protein